MPASGDVEMKAIAAIFDVVPGWFYAILLAIALGALAMETDTANKAKLEAQTQKTAVQTMKTAIEKLKADAAQELADQTGKTLALQQKLDAAKNAQEIRDAENRKAVAALSDRLRAAGGPTLQLRDPFQPTPGCWGGSGSPAPQGASSAGDRSDNPAAAGGLLSPELTRFLQSKDDDADAINLAYISCRTDAQSLRDTLNSTP